MNKLFFEEKTGKYFKTLAEAKRAHECPYIYRVWKENDGMEIGRELVFAYGESTCTIRLADKIIEESRLKF